MLGCKCVGVSAVGFLVLTVGTECLAQPMPLARRTGGILVCDSQGDKLSLLRDVDGDGTINTSDPLEHIDFFSAANQSGLLSPVANPTAIMQTADGTVYVCDLTTRSIYALRDNNGNGTANDAGEARLWFSQAANAEAFTMGAPLALGADTSGAIFIGTAGTGSLPQRAIYRTVDLGTQDGNANGPGEATIWADLSNLILPTNTSSIQDMCFIGDRAYIMDTRANSPTQALLTMQETGGVAGQIDAAEFGVFAFNGDSNGNVVGVSCVTDGVSIYTHESGQSTAHRIFRYTDGNVNNTIDVASERVEVWNVSAISPALPASNAFAIAVGPGGDLALATSSGTRMVAVMHDGSGDGDFMDANETKVIISTTATTTAYRQLTFYAAACKADFNASWVVTIDDLFLYFNAYFLSDPKADINGVGGVTIDDLFLFINLWFTGC